MATEQEQELSRTFKSTLPSAVSLFDRYVIISWTSRSIRRPLSRYQTSAKILNAALGPDFTDHEQLLAANW